MKNLNLTLLTFVGGALISLSSPADAADPKTLDELVKSVRAGNAEQTRILRSRENAFRAEKSRQARLLADAKKKLAAVNARGVALEKRFRDNEKKKEDLTQQRDESLGTMKDLFGSVREIAADAEDDIKTSIVSAEKPGRDKRLNVLAASKSLPSVEELEYLFTTLLEEMTETGKVTRFVADVAGSDGAKEKQEVVRVGGFNLISDGGYLQFVPKVQELSILGRQPADRYISTTRSLLNAQEGPVRFAIDPSRGVILSLLISKPTFFERLQFGGPVGYIIMGLGAFALLIGFVKFITLVIADLRIRRQYRLSRAQTNNALGRVLKVYEDNRQLSPDDLERKLDEVIVRESARVENFIWVVKVVAGAAPLLGLLGTVTGMIQTFQSITLFGTGDPRLMAGGISEALVTTMLGLVVAVPLVLMHAILTNTSKRIVDVIEEQAAGVVARRAESEGAGG